MKTEILYGYHPVLEAIRSDRRNVFEVYFSREKGGLRGDELEKAAAMRQVPLRQLSLSQVRSLSGTASHQGVCAKVSPYEPVALTEMLAEIDPSSPFLLLLDNIIDPQNLGALIRSALCVGVDGVVIPKDRSAPPTPAVSKASSGALEHMRLARVTNMAASISILKQQGVWVMGLAKDAPQNIYQSDLKGPLALVLGGEAHGIRPLVRKQCDKLMSIPQRSALDSLNASVAGAVAMYEAYRQRSAY